MKPKKYKGFVFKYRRGGRHHDNEYIILHRGTQVSSWHYSQKKCREWVDKIINQPQKLELIKFLMG